MNFAIIESMKAFKLLKFIIRPPLKFCIAVWVITLLAVAACLGLYLGGLGGRLWAIAVYAVAAVLFLLSVYLVLTVIGVPMRLRTIKSVHKFFKDRNFRTYVYSGISIIFNICYVVFGIVIAVIEGSGWLGALVGYHVFLAVSRAVVVISAWRHSGDDDSYKLRAYALTGVALIMLALAFVPVIKLVLDDKNTYNLFVEAIIYVCGIALYTCVKLALAVRNLKRAHKAGDRSIIAVRNICLADAFISVFILQAVMLKVIGEPDVIFNRTMNLAIGGAVIAAIFALGVYMLVRGIKMIRATKPDDDAGGENVDEPTGSDAQN